MSRHHAALDARQWGKARRAAIKRDGRRCTRCGLKGSLEVDHILPLDGQGDPYNLDNLRTLCRACHREITAKARRAEADAKVRGKAAWAASVDPFD